MISSINDAIATCHISRQVSIYRVAKELLRFAHAQKATKIGHAIIVKFLREMGHNIYSATDDTA